MSDPLPVLLLGAGGLVGGQVMRAAIGRQGLRLQALVRREVAMPAGARMEMVVAPTEGWTRAIAGMAPQGVICALGTTWRAAGRDEAAFRAVDQHLVLETARAAHGAGADRFTLVSSVGAEAAARSFYLRVKGEVERELARIGFRRVDILQPGLLRGARGGERRLLERVGMLASPLTDLVLQGRWRRYRSIAAAKVARAALQTMQAESAGIFLHGHDEIQELARTFGEMM